MKQTITLTINGRDIVFEMSPELYDKYINEIQSTKKTGPTKNMLMRAVTAESKENLRLLVSLPGAAMQIASMLVEEYAPDLEITVGESSAVPNS